MSDVLGELFHGCALAAYLDVAASAQTWPASEAVRRLAYRYYEEQLQHDNANRGTAPHQPRKETA